jgi:hypothetical protein
MNKIEEFLKLAQEQRGILGAKRLFCVLLRLCELDRTIIIQELGVSRLRVKNTTPYESGEPFKRYVQTRSIAGDQQDLVEETLKPLIKVAKAGGLRWVSGRPLRLSGVEPGEVFGEARLRKEPVYSAGGSAAVGVVALRRTLRPCSRPQPSCPAVWLQKNQP